MYTWGDIKLATLQKMFAADGSSIVADESTKDYLAGMPYAANEGLVRLATAGKFITKSLVISHMPPKNLIAEQKALAISDARTTTFSAENGHSFYLQFTGNARMDITGGDSTITTYFTDDGTWFEWSGNIPNTANNKITITFTSDNPCYVKNVAIYEDTFPTDEEGKAYVPEYGKYIKYDLKERAKWVNSSFYNLGDNAIVYEGGSTIKYLSTTDYYRESDHILVLPANMPGMYTVYYHAYPPVLTIDTLDEFVLEIDPDLAVLLPLYMASELYKDDDNGIATTYRNEFEVGLETLVDTSQYSGKEAFTSEWV